MHARESRLLPRLKWLGLFAGVCVVVLLFVAFHGVMHREEWTDELLGEDQADNIRYGVMGLVTKYAPHDADKDEVPDLLEALRGHAPFDYYNGHQVELLLRGELFRKSDFAYAGGRVRLQLQHRISGAPGGTAPGTRVTLDGQGGRFIAIPRKESYEDEFDPATGEMRDHQGSGTGGLVFYEAPDAPGRNLVITARSHGQRELTVNYSVRVLGRPGAPAPVLAVAPGKRPAGESGFVRVEWEPIQGDHAGVAIEFQDYLGDWLIVAEAPADAGVCEFDDAVVAVNPPKPLLPRHFRVVPFRR